MQQHASREIDFFFQINTKVWLLPQLKISKVDISDGNTQIVSNFNSVQFIITFVCATLFLICKILVLLDKPSKRLLGRPSKNRQVLIKSAPRFEANEWMLS